MKRIHLMRGTRKSFLVYDASEEEVFEELQHWTADRFVQRIESVGNDVVVYMLPGSSIWDEDDVMAVLEGKFGRTWKENW